MMNFGVLILAALVGFLPALSQANEISVFENFGDIVVREGSEQKRLIVPPEMKSHPRFVIRVQRPDPQGAQAQSLIKKEASTDEKVAARRIMYQANQAFFKGEIEKTWELIEQAEKLDPDYYRVVSMKGSLLYKIGSKDLAVDLWRESLEKNPNQPEIRALLEKTQKEL